jgi:hypothetical protein
VTKRTDSQGWPSLIYRFIEHYKWEPQHLYPGKPAAIFHQGIRRQEVPLNLIFSLLLRFSRSEVIFETLKLFGFPSHRIPKSLHLEYPWESNYTQPDIRIESETDRIFIEAKVSATTKLEQLQKYLLLHAEMDTKFGKKAPYLFFLSKNEFRDCWRPRRDYETTENISTFLRRKSLETDLPAKLRTKVDARIVKQFESVRNAIQFGSATWSDVGNRLKAICEQRTSSASQDTELQAIREFLDDLEKRELLIRSQAL